MRVNVKKISSNQVDLELEIPAPDVEIYFQTAASNLSKNMKIDGFRPGKVPLEIVEEKLGSQKLYDEAANLAVSKTLPSVIIENKIEMVGQPEIIVTQIARGNPMKYRAKIWIIPEIKLVNYKGLKIKRKTTKVEPEEINRSLEYLQRSRTKLITSRQPAKFGDRVEIDFITRINGIKIEGGENKNYPLILGESRFIPGFEQELKGMVENQEKKFSLRVPEDWPQKNLADKNLDFEVKMNLIQEREVPKLSDEFAKNLGSFESLEHLKKNITEGIIQEKELKEKERIRIELIEKVAESSEINIPDVLIDIELDKMIDELKINTQNMGLNFDVYLKELKKTNDDLKKEWRKTAEKRVKIALVLREIARKEEIDASEEEIQEKVNQFLRDYQSVKEAKKDIDPQELREYAKSVIKNEKVFQLLEREAKII